MTTPTRDQLELLRELEAQGGSVHVASSRYFDFERLERLGLVKISTLAGREFHCAISDNDRAAIASPQGASLHSGREKV